MLVTIKATKPFWSGIISGHGSFLFSRKKHTDLKCDTHWPDSLYISPIKLNRWQSCTAVGLLKLQFKTIFDTTFNQLANGKMEHYLLKLACVLLWYRCVCFTLHQMFHIFHCETNTVPSISSTIQTLFAIFDVLANRDKTKFSGLKTHIRLIEASYSFMTL